MTSSKPLKTGFLLRYKRRFFGQSWREEFVVLYDDSTMAWYKDKTQRRLRGGVHLNEAPEFMAVGEHTCKIPRRPDLPAGNDAAQLMAFATANKKKVHWFLAKTDKEANDWITAISITLPLPPEFPLIDNGHPDIYENVQLTGCHRNGNAQDQSTAISSKLAGPTSRTCISDAAAGLLVTGGIAISGWGSGLGWTRYWNYNHAGNARFLGTTTEPFLDVDYQNFVHYNGQYGYADTNTYCDGDLHDNDFDMDFGGDMGF